MTDENASPDWVSAGLAELAKGGVKASGESAVESLRGIFTLSSERTNTQGIAIELAIRQWARTDPAAAKTQRG